MKKYFCLTLLSIVLLAVFLPSVQPALGLEANYPNIPGFPNAQELLQRGDFLVFLRYAFWFIVVVSGIIGVISIVVAGLGILLNAASGNASALGAAKERIWAAILGIVVLMIAIIILRTVNTDLVNVTSSGAVPREQVTGTVYLVWTDDYPLGDNSGDNAIESPTTVPDTQILDFRAAIRLYYSCTNPSPLTPAVLIRVYSRKEYRIDYARNGAYNVTTHRIECEDGISLERGNANEILSYQYQFEDPGVYYYLTENCTGMSTCVDNGANTCADKDGGMIPRFDRYGTLAEQVVRSIRIVNPEEFRYSTVLQRADGICSKPLMFRTADANGCIKVPHKPKFAKYLQRGINAAELGIFDTDAKLKFHQENYYSRENPLVRLARPDNVDFNPTSTIIMKQDLNIGSRAGVRFIGLDGQIFSLSAATLGNHYNIYPHIFAPAPENSPELEEDGISGYGMLPNVLTVYSGRPLTPENRGTAVCAMPDSGATTDYFPYPSQSCLNQIITNRRYYVVLYTNNLQNNKSCRAFSDNINDMSRGIQANGNLIYRAEIIPKYSSSDDTAR